MVVNPMRLLSSSRTGAQGRDAASPLPAVRCPLWSGITSVHSRLLPLDVASCWHTWPLTHTDLGAWRVKCTLGSLLFQRPQAVTYSRRECASMAGRRLSPATLASASAAGNLLSCSLVGTSHHSCLEESWLAADCRPPTAGDRVVFRCKVMAAFDQVTLVNTRRSLPTILMMTAATNRCHSRQRCGPRRWRLPQKRAVPEMLRPPPPAERRQPGQHASRRRCRWAPVLPAVSASAQECDANISACSLCLPCMVPWWRLHATVTPRRVC